MIQTLDWQENISLSNVEPFKNAIHQLLRSNSSCLILNVENVSYMNSRSLGIIAKAAKDAREMNKELIMISKQDSLHKILTIVHFSSIIKIFSSLSEGEHYFLKTFATSNKIVV